MKNRCEKIRENIQGYFEKSLSKGAFDNTEEHLRECPECSWYFREYEKMDEILSRWEAPFGDENFEEKVTAVISGKAAKKGRFFLLFYINSSAAVLSAVVLALILALVYYISLPVVIGQGKETGDKIISEEGPVFEIKTGKWINAKNSDLEIFLNDGSLLLLAKGSSLSVDTFGRDKKVCTLLGELKAEIRKYPGQEFIIKTENAEVRVLGTVFLVSAMKNRTIVSVIEGSLAVKGRREKTQLTKGNIALVSGPGGFLSQESAPDAVKNKDKFVRIQAAKALTELKGKEEIQGVLSLLNDTDETVRAEAALQLGAGGAGSRDAARLLLNALRDRNKFVRMNAAVSLGKLKVMEAREHLKRMVKDADPEGKIGGAAGLFYLGERPYELEDLMKELDSRNADNRIYALKVLGKTGGEKAALKITEKLKDPEKRVRWYAVAALERLNESKTFLFLVEAVKDPEQEIKIKVLQALSGVFYSEAAGFAASEITETSSREVRFTAVRTLGYLLMAYYKADRQNLVGILEKSINDRDPLIKVAALAAYARAAGPEAAQKIYEISVKDGNTIMKETSAEILKIIKKQGFRFNLRPLELRALGKLKEKMVVPLLIKAARDWNPPTREAAMEGFEELNDKMYLPVLYEGMKDREPLAAEAAEEAVKNITNK